MKYMEIDPAISTLTYRVATVERKNEELEAALKQTAESLRQLRQELAVGRVLIKEDNQAKAKAVLAGVLDEADIVVPKELRIRPAKRKQGMRHSGGGNRTSTVTAKRWALWKLQREQGYTYQQIARAWGCNHTAVTHAASKNFKPYKNYGRGRR